MLPLAPPAVPAPSTRAPGAPSPSVPDDVATVVVELGDVPQGAPLAPGSTAAATLAAFHPGDPVELLFVLDREPTPLDEAAFAAACASAATGPTGAPAGRLVGPSADPGPQALLRVRDGGSTQGPARDVAMVMALAQALRDRTAAPGPARHYQRVRALLEVARTAHDVGRESARRPSVMVLAQHPATWGALGPVAEAALDHPDVDLRVVALDAAAHHPEVASLAARGVPVLGAQDGVRALDEVDVVVLCDPYDEYRPEGLRSTDLLDRGLRLVLSPYSENTAGGPELARQHDTALHNLAWRVYAATSQQRDLFAAHCASGAGHVRSLGSVKGDWVAAGGHAVRAEAAVLRRRLGTRAAVLWNPHFRVGPGGWSTFERYAGELLALAAATPRTGLIVRPHFRLLALTEASSDARREVVDGFRRACAAVPTVVLDESPDYRPAFAASDAMVSDLSSLIPEYLRLGRPVGYLHSPTGPDLVDDPGGWTSRVTWIGDAAELARFVRGVRRQKPSGEPHPDLGAGRRVVQSIVDDLREERVKTGSSAAA